MQNELHPQLAPYEPTAQDPFDSVKAAHLLNRAGFGGTEAEVQKVRDLGPQKAVEWLLDFPDKTATEMDPKDVPDLSAVANYPADMRQMYRGMADKTPQEQQALRMKFQMDNAKATFQTIGWWMRRMAHGPYPLQEKLTFFWHGHFTTSMRDERSVQLLWDQNELLREMAAGNFRKFVHAISRNPAMLDYLNNTQNRKEHPNENYARELMELFTLGIGNYTEDDVKAGARAFTGWTHDGEKYVFRRMEHDEGQKTFLGKTGNFNGDDVIDIILEKPVCATYMAGRFWKFFVQEEPDTAVVQSLSEVFRKSDYEVRTLLGTMFNSRAFYSPEVIGAQVKCPVQLAVGTSRILGLEMPDQGARGPAGMRVGQALKQLGQVPLDPPNVKGWPGGRAWINTSSLFVRYNMGVQLAEQARLQPPGGSPEKIVDSWVERLIQRPIIAQSRKVLLDAVGAAPDIDSVRRMISLIMSMPEYQLC